MLPQGVLLAVGNERDGQELEEKGMANGREGNCNGERTEMQI